MMEKISVSGNTFNGQRMDDFEVEKGNLLSYIKNKVRVDFEFEIKENHIIVIKDLEEDLLVFLNKCHINISKFVQKLENI